MVHLSFAILHLYIELKFTNIAIYVRMSGLVFE